MFLSSDASVSYLVLRVLLLLTCQPTVEVIGYVGRAISVNTTGQLGPYIIQATFIFIPPAFFAATIYMCLARIIRLGNGDHLSVIKPRIVTRIFVTGDILSFSIQGNAAGLLVHANLRTIATVLIIFFFCYPSNLAAAKQGDDAAIWLKSQATRDSARQS